MSFTSCLSSHANNCLKINYSYLNTCVKPVCTDLKHLELVGKQLQQKNTIHASLTVFYLLQRGINISENCS